MSAGPRNGLDGGAPGLVSCKWTGRSVVSGVNGAGPGAGTNGAGIGWMTRVDCGPDDGPAADGPDGPDDGPDGPGPVANAAAANVSTHEMPDDDAAPDGTDPADAACLACCWRAASSSSGLMAGSDDTSLVLP